MKSLAIGTSLWIVATITVLGCEQGGPFELEPDNDVIGDFEEEEIPYASQDRDEVLGSEQQEVIRAKATFLPETEVLKNAVTLESPAEVQPYSSTAVPRGEVWLYTGTNFTGSKLVVDHTDFKSLIWMWNNNIESMKVGPETYANLFGSSNYFGTKKLFPAGSYANLSVYGFSNNTLSSIQTRPNLGWVWLFTGDNYSGNVLEINSDKNYVGSAFNDNIKSIKVGYRTSATVYQHNNYAGGYYNSKTHTTGWNIWGISSVKVRPAQGWVWFYSGANFSSKEMHWGMGFSNLASLHRYTDHGLIFDDHYSWNDCITSFKLGPDTVLNLYKDSGHKGTKWIYTNSVSDLPSGPDNKVSSFSIHPDVVQ